MEILKRIRKLCWATKIVDFDAFHMTFDRRFSLQIPRYLIISLAPLTIYIFLTFTNDQLLNSLANIGLVYVFFSLGQTYFITRSYITATLTGDNLNIQTRMGWINSEQNINLSMIEKVSSGIFRPYILLKNGDRIPTKKGLPSIFLIKFGRDFLDFLKDIVQDDK